jgi:hypothetical protein
LNGKDAFMSSSFFLEILEERALLSSQVLFLTTPVPGLDLLAIVGHAENLASENGSTAILGKQELTYSVNDGSGNIPGNGKSMDGGSAASDSSLRGLDFHLLEDLQGSPSYGNLVPGEMEGLRMRILTLLDIRQTAAVEANSVVDALQSRNQDKNSDDDARMERDARRYDDNDAGDHGSGGTPGNGFLNSTPVRSFDDLAPEVNLFDPAADLESAFLPGPLGDSIFIDGWRDSIPLPRAELVPATGHDLTVMATYLVGSVPTTSPDQLVPAPLDPGPTNFIVGYSPASSDQTHCPISTSTRAPIIQEPIGSGEQDTTRKGEDTRPTPTSIPTSEPAAEGTNPVTDDDTDASEEASSPSEQ